MPKLKTKKAAAKRFKLSATGKIRYKKQGLRHCLSSRTTNQKRPLRKTATGFRGDQKTVYQQLPYGA